MKTTQLKSLIKEAVKEAIQDELKDILLEAVKSPKPQIVRESIQPSPTPPPSPKPTYTEPTMNIKQRYADIVGETALSMTSKDASSFNPKGVDPLNGNLGDGEVGMDTIMNLLNPK